MGKSVWHCLGAEVGFKLPAALYRHGAIPPRTLAAGVFLMRIRGKSISARASVKLNLRPLRDRLSRQSGRSLDARELHDWLTRHGFRLGQSGWECYVSAIDLLESVEIQEAIMLWDGTSAHAGESS
jgi:hypothetical protein